ncbi:MAG: TrkA family potassium uptake protein [Candidatus Micrarchaeota archaeon]
MRIVIFGLGRVGMNLIKLLKPAHAEVVVVDTSREKCEHIASEYNAVVVCGDCTDPEILEDLRMNEADYVFAITGEEATNFLTSIYAKNAGARHVIARCESTKHSIVMEKLGVESLVPETTLAQELANRVLNPTIFKMLDPEKGNLDLYEVSIPDNVKGKPVRDVFKQKDVTLLALYDGEKFTLPHGDDKIVGKKAIVVSTGGRKKVW